MTSDERTNQSDCAACAAECAEELRQLQILAVHLLRFLGVVEPAQIEINQRVFQQPDRMGISVRRFGKEAFVFSIDEEMQLGDRPFPDAELTDLHAT